VVELAEEGPIPRQSGTGGASPPQATATHRWRILLRHWMPWLIPLLAIGLPMLFFILAGSIPVAAWRWGEAPTSLGRGDFLIPVLILCLEAIRHWWYEVTCGRLMGIVGLVGCVLCLAAAAVCAFSFAVASSHPVTADSTKSIIVITWACFAVGLFSGTIGLWVSTPKAGK
jgi:hypothetical protein